MNILRIRSWDRIYRIARILGLGEVNYGGKGNIFRHLNNITPHENPPDGGKNKYIYQLVSYHTDFEIAYQRHPAFPERRGATSNFSRGGGRLTEGSKGFNARKIFYNCFSS